MMDDPSRHSTQVIANANADLVVFQTSIDRIDRVQRLTQCDRRIFQAMGC